jgi:sugar phosphate isomerase/epimerase
MLPNNDLSFQLWSSRASQSLPSQLQTLKAYGYTDVQPFHDQWNEPERLRAALDEFGLTCKSGHFTMELLENEHAQVVSASQLLGVKLVVAPWLDPDKRPKDRDGWMSIGVRLAQLSKRYFDVGLGFAWHNHDFEFVRLPDGSYPIEHVLGEDLLFEIDVAWVFRAKVDPLPWLKRYAGRIPAVHIKDMAPEGDKLDEDGWADVGTGIVPWRQLWPAVVASGAQLMIAEHDNPSDYIRFARVSADAIRSLAREGS